MRMRYALVVGVILQVLLAMSGAATVVSAHAEEVDAPPDTNVVQNGDFSAGVTGWLQFALPDASGMVSNNGAGGVFEFYRAGAQAVVFQQTGQTLPVGAPIEASFDLGNTDSVRKRISVLVHDADFLDLHVCTFWLPPNLPLTTYTMWTHTTKAWNNLTVSIYAATVGTGGFYQVDNVSVAYSPALEADRTVCFDPLLPASPTVNDSPNFITNGGFATGDLSPWTLYGQITGQVTGGVFEFIKNAGSPSGVILQASGQVIAADQVLTASFQLGNSSGVRKRVTAILHDNNFSDLSACTFWLAPGQPLSNYIYRAVTTAAWTNATLSIYPATVGADQWILLDNASFTALNTLPPGTTFPGTECYEPPGGAGDARATDTARAPGARASVASAPAGEQTTDAQAAAGTGLSITDGDSWIADGFAQTGDPSPTGTAPSWIAVAGETTHTLTRVAPIELTAATSAVLHFESWLSGTSSRATVQVSLDGLSWETVRVLGSSDGWTAVDVDLLPYGGEPVQIRFALDAVNLADSAMPDTWRIGDIALQITAGPPLAARREARPRQGIGR